MECVIVNKLKRTIEYTNVCVYEQVKCEEINGKSFVSYIMGTLKVSGVHQRRSDVNSAVADG